MSRLLKGTDLAEFIKERQAKQVRALRQAHSIFPRLAIVTDSDNPVIATYVRLKQQYGADILIDVEIHQVQSSEVLETVRTLNSRSDVQGIIVQLPLINQEQTNDVLKAVSPNKDVDGLNPETTFDAATPMAINWLLAGHNIDLAGRQVAIVGRGRLVGAPLERMWRNSGVEVTMFEKGDDLTKLKQFDIVITATGQPHIVSSGFVKSGVVLVDAGTASESGKIVGDVAPDLRERDDIAITPEKGGVGPLTVTALFDNVITACFRIANS